MNGMNQGSFLRGCGRSILTSYYIHTSLDAINKHVFHMQSVVQEELKAPAKSEN